MIRNYRDQNLPFRKFQPEKRLPKILGDHLGGGGGGGGGGFENPRRGRRCKKVNNKCFETSRSQIVFRTDSFHKLSLGAPERFGTQVCYLGTVQ